MMRTTVWAGFALLLAACATPYGRATSSEDRAAVWFDEHRQRPTIVRMFLQRMPKGGDIHTHLSGAVYAESYVEWAAAANPPLCADPASRKIAACCATCPGRPVADALRDPAFYSSLVDDMSTRNLGSRSGHDQFFGVFGRFRDAAANRSVDMLAEVTSRAADQHVSYLEVMLTVAGDAVRKVGASVPFDPGDLAGSRQRLLDAGLRAPVSAALEDLDALEHAVSERLGCAGDGRPPACRVIRRYLQQTTRTLEPGVVFAQLVFAFELAQAGRRVVGINLVAPEDDRVARRDYDLHMRMVGWLAEQYPAVNVALHAGELTMGLVPPADLAFHIRDAVLVARARRIGHGVAIAYERDAPELLAAMRQRDVLVEICLTSNDVILGVKGRDHPLMDYLGAGVPAALATDDEGISRIDLTNEYVRAAQTYGLGYRELKRMARQSLAHSFLAGRSLWRDGASFERVPECAADGPSEPPSAGCRAFLDRSDKAHVQWEHERELTTFESMEWAAGIR